MFPLPWTTAIPFFSILALGLSFSPHHLTSPWYLFLLSPLIGLPRYSYPKPNHFLSLCLNLTNPTIDNGNKYYLSIYYLSNINRRQSRVDHDYAIIKKGGMLTCPYFPHQSSSCLIRPFLITLFSSCYCCHVVFLSFHFGFEFLPPESKSWPRLACKPFTSNKSWKSSCCILCLPLSLTAVTFLFQKVMYQGLNKSNKTSTLIGCQMLNNMAINDDVWTKDAPLQGWKTEALQKRRKMYL